MYVNAHWFLCNSLDLVYRKMWDKQVTCIHIACLKCKKFPSHTFLAFSLLQSYRGVVATLESVLSTLRSTSVVHSTQNIYSPVQFSSVLLPIGSWRGFEGWFSRDPLPVFWNSAGSHCEQFWLGQGCPLFDVVLSAFSLPTSKSSTLQGALKDGFWEAVVMCDIPNHASWQWSEEVSVDLQGSWSCSAPSRVHCTHG